MPQHQVGADEQHVEDGDAHLQHADTGIGGRLCGGEGDGANQASSHDREDR
jgi:hypothetical protein